VAPSGLRAVLLRAVSRREPSGVNQGPSAQWAGPWRAAYWRWKRAGASLYDFISRQMPLKQTWESPQTSGSISMLPAYILSRNGNSGPAATAL